MISRVHACLLLVIWLWCCKIDFKGNMLISGLYDILTGVNSNVLLCMMGKYLKIYSKVILFMKCTALNTAEEMHCIEKRAPTGCSILHFPYRQVKSTYCLFIL